MSDEFDMFDDYPEFTPGRVHYGTLYRILEWEQKHGIASTSKDIIDAYREDGCSAAQTGLELGLIDYPQATGHE